MPSYLFVFKPSACRPVLGTLYVHINNHVIVLCQCSSTSNCSDDSMSKLLRLEEENMFYKANLEKVSTRPISSYNRLYVSD